MILPLPKKRSKKSWKLDRAKISKEKHEISYQKRKQKKQMGGVSIKELPEELEKVIYKMKDEIEKLELEKKRIIKITNDHINRLIGTRYILSKQSDEKIDLLKKELVKIVKKHIKKNELRMLNNEEVKNELDKIKNKLKIKLKKNKDEDLLDTEIKIILKSLIKKINKEKN